MSVRVRFAPSPTGYLHVGGARTALYNYLFARHHGGVFVLRIEDTDRGRSSDEMTRAILDGLGWLGLDVDEGPVHQADGVDRHRGDALRLLEAGQAYRCFCTAEELAARRAEAEQRGEGFGYDGRCRHTSAVEANSRVEAGEPFAVRFEVPEGSTSWQDLVHGTLSFENASIDDFVILRSDSTPVYNLAVVSDDAAAGITHVIRGDDHISNTPKQILLYRQLGYTLPEFGHVPMILGPDGKRLSKRHGAMAIGAYGTLGFLPAGMVNFLALLGWSPGDDREVMGLAEMVELFDLGRVQKKSAVFDTEKLEWLNGQHIARTPARELAPLVLDELEDEPEAGSADAGAGVSAAARAEMEANPGRAIQVIDLVKERPRTIPLLVAQVSPFFGPEVAYDEHAVHRFWKRPAESAELLRALQERFRSVDPWAPEPLETALRSLAEELEIGAGKMIHPLRVALMGQGVSPGIFDVLALMGRERTERRVESAIGFLDARTAWEAGRSPGEGHPR
jgi:glutamyl-tRNA synthetase